MTVPMLIAIVLALAWVGRIAWLIYAYVLAARRRREKQEADEHRRQQELFDASVDRHRAALDRAIAAGLAAARAEEMTAEVFARAKAAPGGYLDRPINSEELEEHDRNTVRARLPDGARPPPMRLSDAGGIDSLEMGKPGVD